MTTLKKLVLAPFAVGAIVFGALASGCGSDTVCDQAADKASQCGIQDVMLTDSGEDCEAIAECQARCVLNADCGDIEAAVEGQQNSVRSCTDSCG